MRYVLLAALAACHFSSTGNPGEVAPDGTTSAPDAPSVAAVTCTGKSAEAGDQTWTVTSSGIPRLVYAHVPANYDPARGTALVFNFHGFTSDALQEAVLSLMNDKAEAEGFVVLYPVGTGAPLSWNAGACCGTATATNVDDIQFVKDILATAEDKLCIDPARVYATGMSNGGFLSHRIGCELADRFAAIAPVAGVMGIDSCTPSRPMPVMHFHGTQDPLVPWDGSATLGFPSVMATFTGWAMRDGCTGNAVETYSHGDAHCSTYQHCNGGADVTLCTIEGGGHTWPGGTPVQTLGFTSTDIHATDAMWTFFQAHHL